MHKSFKEDALFELHFWLQILGDHSRFIHDSLAPSEIEKIKIADTFIKNFDQLLITSKQKFDEQQIWKKARLHRQSIPSIMIYFGT